MSVGTYIGTSGWDYDHWQGSFYPSGLAGEAFLEYYAGCFGTAEINNSFYRLPEKETLLRWRDAVPEGFVFSVKASRFSAWRKKGLDVYCYFDNDEAGYAAQDVLGLQQMTREG